MADLSILVLNSGSSSIKFSSYRAEAAQKTLLHDGAVDGIGTGNGSFHIKSADGVAIVDKKLQIADRDAAFALIADALQHPPFAKPDAIGHRVVAGGPRLRDHQRITPEVLTELKHSIGFAPLHNPSAIYIIQKLQELFPEVPNFVCFDSAFHQTMLETAAHFPLPVQYWLMGVRRYGAHGLSCESIVSQLADKTPSRLIVAHLGNGCSVTAIKDGKSIDTSMGLTPTGGIISSTRTGDLDPGVLVYILRDLKADDPGAVLGRDEAANKLEKLVNQQSGLLGVSQGLSDMRDLRKAAAQDNPVARLALDQFTYVLRKWIGSYFVALGGLDLLVFTGGIGEHDQATRRDTCAGLASIGITIDNGRNESLQKDAGGQAIISADGSAVKVAVIPPLEDLMIANHVFALMHA